MATRPGVRAAGSVQQKTDYVTTRSKQSGGWKDAWRGFRHRVLPDLIGLESFRLSSAFFLLVRLLLLLVAAALPVVTKKVGEVRAAAKLSTSGVGGVAKPAQAASSSAPTPFGQQIFEFQGISFDLFDLLVVLGALVVAIGPQLWAWYKSQRSEEARSRALEALAGSIQGLPAPGQAASANDVVRSCDTALHGLSDEIARSIGDHKADLTDAVLLVFADTACTTMKPLVRTETGESQTLGRVLNATDLQAFFVAKTGTVFAEHDFGGEDSPFPPTRVTPNLANTPTHYKSVLFIPVIVRTDAPAGGGLTGTVQKFVCVGVICIHSRLRYRFWRWGDHRQPQSAGGAASAAVRKAATYQQVIAHCLKTNYPQLAV